ncbi:twin-arginine translocation signal domain-containing protein, partial [bacterium]
MTYQPTRRSFIQLAGAATAGATLAGPLLAEAKDADTSALYAAAKKEGSITWWTAHYAQDAAEAVRDAFVKKYPGIQVSFIRQTAQVVFQR